MVSVPPGHAAVHDSLLEIFTYLKTNPTAAAQLELEGRLGRMVQNGRGEPRFEPGIDAALFEALLAQFRGSTSFNEVSTVESGDFFFKNRIRGTVVHDGRSADEFSFMRKSAVRQLDITCALGQHSARSALRLSLKKEVPLDISRGRDVGLYSHVRIKQRTSFLYKMWSFDFTRVWEGEDPIAARTNPRVPGMPKPPDRYEVEIEFLPRADEAKDAPADYLAVSMMEKLGDLVRREERAPAREAIDFVLAGDVHFDESGQRIQKK